MKIQLFLETENAYLEGQVFETQKETLIEDVRQKALETWSREEIAVGSLLYNDLTNHIFSCPIHEEVFPEDCEFFSYFN